MEQIWITRWEKGVFSQVQDFIAEEGYIHVDIGCNTGFGAVATLEKVRPFVYGHLFSEGIIRSVDEVVDYQEFIVDENTVFVETRLRDPPVKGFRLVGLACLDYGSRLGEVGEGVKPLPSSTFPLVSAEKLVEIQEKILGETEDFRLTGAYHYAFLFDSKLELAAKAKDVGRHNAVDKVVGEVLLRGNSFSGSILFTTGRVSMDIVLKCLRCGIPLLVSRGAVLLGAIRLAKRYNLGLVGFLRGQRFNIYSGENRIRS